MDGKLKGKSSLHIIFLHFKLHLIRDIFYLRTKSQYETFFHKLLLEEGQLLLVLSSDEKIFILILYNFQSLSVFLTIRHLCDYGRNNLLLVLICIFLEISLRNSFISYRFTKWIASAAIIYYIKI